MRLSRAFLTTVVLVAGCTGGAEEQAPAEEPLLPGGYKVQLDTDRPDPGQFNITDATDMVRFTTGPAGLAWRPQDVVGPGDVRVEGTFQLYGAPVGYREAYGIFVGGRDLDGPSPSYAYLLIRAGGDFTIRIRRGDLIETPVDWTPHPAVERVERDGDEPVNRLAIQVRGTDTDFLLNGTRIFRMDAGDVQPRGIAGVRINHRLDLGLTSWSLAPLPPLDPDSTSGT